MDSAIIETVRQAPLCLAIILVSTNVPLGAQWLRYPTPGVPKTSTGAPNLSAPPPRTSEGKPDLSGIWAPEKNRPCPPGGCDDMQIPYEFLDIGWSLKGGLPYQPWAAGLVRTRKAEAGIEDPTTHCLPGGVVKVYTTPLLHKIVQTPGLILILSERDASYRQIFTDGRPLPADPQPSWNGYSTGKWEGDKLVIETSGFRDGLWLDRNGSPLTDAAKMTERLYRPSYGKLEVEISVDDPKAYTKPWTVKLNQLLVLDTELLDYICLENEKDVPHFGAK
ncbi:MAG: hypothetical protein JOZ22_01945 [Acidobacteriia bacterium]|nr:hypothetical protein [Terriglobia bacterium]MBV9747066.1 hypothetical protein [Terriglobia bacterium]